MSSITFAPPFCAGADGIDRLRSQGHVVFAPIDTAHIAGTSIDDLDALHGAWADLPPDRYLKDGGRYRRRRHSCFVVERDVLHAVPHRGHWQPVEYNALHGGMWRLFEPIDDAVVTAPAWTALLGGLAAACRAVRPVDRWFVEAHQFRIDTEDGIGRPTPEGAHRDGVDFVAVLLVDRRGIVGGETRVFDAAGPNGQRFTMTDRWTLLLLDDARVIHETTPIQPRERDAPGAAGWRDTLVVTFREGGFQGD